MKRILTIIALLFVVVQTASAVPAYPRPVQYQLPDGSSIQVKLYGDEFFNYMLTSDGYQVTALEDGFLYYYVPGVGTKNSQSMRASSPSRRSSAEQSFVRSLRSGVDPMYLSTGRYLAQERRATMKTINPNDFAPFSSFSAKSNTKTRELAARSLVILCQFKDIKFQTPSPESAFNNLLNQKGYSVNGAIGSSKDYFQENSLGKYDPTFDVSPIVTLSESMEYYGRKTASESDIRPREMIREACELANKAGVDFSKYDYNNDGFVDNVFVFYAGYNQAEGGPSESIWPHRWMLDPGGRTDLRITLNGKTVNDYACTSELKGSNGATMCGIGTFTHEFGHVLGLPDFYDSDYDGNGGNTVGLYDLCVMGSGAYNDGGNTPAGYIGLERWLVGWAEMKDLNTAPDNLTIYPVHTKEGNDCWKVEMPNNPGEFIYLEARQKTRWDATFTTEGLLIYQIDRSENIVGGRTALAQWDKNGVNAYFNHPCARIIESGGKATKDGRHGDMFYPGSSKNTVFLTTSYGFKDWSGNFLPMGFTGISQANGTVSLRVVRDLSLSTISGKVVDENSSPISGVDVIVTEIVADAPASTPLRLVSKAEISAATRADVSYTTSTDGSGQYILSNIPYGNYNITFQREGYDSQVHTLELNKARVTLDINIKRFIAKLSGQVSWANGESTSYLDIAKPIWVGASWTAADLAAVNGKRIGGIAVETGAITSYDARLYVNNKMIYQTKGSTVAGGRTLVYLPSMMDIKISNQDAVRVEFKVESGKTSIAVDKGPAIKGKGDLYSENGSQWVTLSDNGINANAMIGLLWDKDSDVPEIPMVSSVCTQRSAALSFSSADGNITLWNLRYKTGGGQWTEVNGIKTSTYTLNNLNPETTYQGELEAVFADKKSAPKAFEFTTTNLSAPFAAIGNVKGRYALNESYTLNCVNIQAETTSIEWKWNGGSIRSESITFAAQGKGRLDCIITYKDGSKEVLSREIVVE